MNDFPPLAKALGTRTPLSDIINLLKDANPDLHTARRYDLTPLMTESQRSAGTKQVLLGYVITPAQRQPWLRFPATATTGMKNTVGIVSSASKHAPDLVTTTEPGSDHLWAYQSVSIATPNPFVLGIS